MHRADSSRDQQRQQDNSRPETLGREQPLEPVLAGRH
jgi:hypothetical protein